MPIAKVRIAPVEQWCDWYKKPATKNARARASADRIVGMEVEIDTKSLSAASCKPGAKMWNITKKSREELLAKVGYAGGQFGVCEHMLEMD